MQGFCGRTSSVLVVFVVLLALLACITITFNSAQALTIDEFNGSQSIAANQTNQTNVSAATDSGIAGGHRKLKLMWLSGANAPSLDTDATVVRQDNDGTFVYSQDATVAAQCLISWDGTSAAASAANLAPQGLDLRQDGGNAFVFELLGNDIPAQLDVQVVDATDLSKTSSATAIVAAGGARVVTLPFSAFNGTASLNTVGSLALLINKGASQALDLSLSYIGTNGTCRLVPNSAGKVIDECGVCAGDNSSCADCRGIPNGSAVIDQCGICAGNGTSCLDCAGAVNGSAVMDRCGVCNGDGKSCLNCNDKDITLVLSTMDAGAKLQEALLKNIYRQIEKSTKRRATLKQVAALRTQAHKLQIRNWTLAWTTPRIATICENTQFCTSVSNQAVISEYRRNNESLRQMAVDALKLWQKVNKNARKQVPSYLKSAARIFNNNEKFVARVPATESACT